MDSNGLDQALRNFPIDLFGEVVAALMHDGIDVMIIGSFALLELLPSARWPELSTDDVDLHVALNDMDQVSSIGRAMESLGFCRPKERPGKWLRDEAVVDIIARTVPSGFGPPACLAEPFANVVYLDRRPASVLAKYGQSNGGSRLYVSGPAVTILGKALKVWRYIHLDDWHVNELRRTRAHQATNDILRILYECRVELTADRSRLLVERAKSCGGGVEVVLSRAVDALNGLVAASAGAGAIQFDAELVARLGGESELAWRVSELAYWLKG